jgi:putative membrane protein
LDGHVAGSIASRYRVLRGVTTGHVSSLLMLLLLSSIISVQIFIGTSNGVVAIITLISLASLYMLYNRLLDLIFQNRYETFTARRLDSLSVVELLITTVASTIYHALRAAGLETSLSTAVMTGFISVATYLGYSVRRAIGGSIAVSLISSISPPLTTYMLAYIYSRSVAYAAIHAVSTLVSAVALMEAVRHIIDSRLSLKNVKLFQLCQAFFRALLAGGSAGLERMLSHLSLESTVLNDVFILRRDVGRPVAIVVTDVHPGPFRNVGSSTFPSLVQRMMATKGLDAIVLKGLSSHEKNLADSLEAEKLASSLAMRAHDLLTEGIFSSSITFPKRDVLNGAKTLWWKMAGNTLCLMTLHPSPMEDLPSEIAGNMDSLIPVDTHNCFDRNYKALDSESLEKLRNLVEHLRNNNGADPDEIHVGLSRFIPPGLGLADGMGPGGMSCLIMGGRSGRIGIVVADANNAAPWVRDLVRKVAGRYGIDDVELCTTDTHCVNAVTLGGKGYHPLGEVIPAETLEPILDRLFREALSGMSRAEAAYARISSRHTVFSDLIESLSGRISSGARIYLSALFLTPLLSSFLTLIL